MFTEPLNSLSFANVFVPKNEDFLKFAKILSVNFLQKVNLAKINFVKFRHIEICLIKVNLNNVIFNLMYRSCCRCKKIRGKITKKSNNHNNKNNDITIAQKI